MAKRFYAVQYGRYDTDCAYGSTDWDEALAMARSIAEDNPEDEVRIVYCTTESDYAHHVVLIQEGDGLDWCGERPNTLEEEEYGIFGYVDDSF